MTWFSYNCLFSRKLRKTYLVKSVFKSFTGNVYFYFWIASEFTQFSSKRGHVTEKHVLTGRKHDMLGNQTFELRRPLSKLSHQSWKVFDVFDKQILLKLQTWYSSAQDFRNEVIQMAATRPTSEIRERYRMYRSF